MIHTFSIKKQLNNNELNEFLQGFNISRRESELLRNDRRGSLTISGHLRCTNRGIKSVQIHRRADPPSFNIVYYAVIKIEPQELLSGRRTVELFTPSENNVVELSRRLQIELSAYLSDSNLTTLSNWNCNRIDYTHNFQFENETDRDLFLELTRKCSRYFRRERAHLQGIRSCDQSTAERNRSVKVIFYNKAKEIRERYLHISENTRNSLLEEAAYIIRYEVQCNKGRVQSMQLKYNFEDRNITHYLNERIAQDVLLTEYERTVGTGTFYKKSPAERLIDASNFRPSKKEHLKQFLRLIAQARHLNSAKTQFISGTTTLRNTDQIVCGSLNTFRNRIRDLQSIGINPVLIPQNRIQQEFRNPIFELENL